MRMSGGYAMTAVVVVVSMTVVTVVMTVGMTMRPRRRRVLMRMPMTGLVFMPVHWIISMAGHLPIRRHRSRQTRQTSRFRRVGHVNSWLHDSCYPSFKTL